MQRFARATAAQLDDLLRDASTGGADLGDVEYPPGADPGRGPLRFVVPSRGGLLVLVDAARFPADDFRLAVLFERGRCSLHRSTTFGSSAMGRSPTRSPRGVHGRRGGGCDTPLVDPRRAAARARARVRLTD